MIDPHRLRILRAVVATGSMRRAAANLGYTPSAVSQHLSSLQRETGLRLLEREGRGVRPTSAGVTLAGAAAGVLEELAELDGTVERLRQGRVGTLTVQHFASVGAAWMPEILATLTLEYPDLQLELRLDEQDDGSSGAPDVGIVIDDGHPPPAGWDAHPLIEEPFLVAVPAAHRLATASRIPLVDLSSEPWVDNDPIDGSCRRLILDACASVGFSPRFKVEAYDYATALAFVSAGLGITVLPRLAFTALSRPGLAAVAITEPVPTRRLAVRVRSALGQNVAVQRILELLHERAADVSAA